jgi:predicted phage tail protein
LDEELKESRSLLNKSEKELKNSFNLREETYKLHLKINQIESGHSSRVVELEGEIATIVKERDSLKALLAENDNVIKVKDSMLDDQNESLKSLKKNLENKNRDHQAVLKELETYRDAYEELAEKDTKELEAEVYSILNYRLKL